jgi:hypothetical protein
MSWTKTTTTTNEWSKPSTTAADWSKQRYDTPSFSSTDKANLTWTDATEGTSSWTNGSPSLFTSKAIDGYFNEWNDYFNLSEEYFGYTAFDEIAPGLSDFSGVSKSDTSDWTKL